MDLYDIHNNKKKLCFVFQIKLDDALTGDEDESGVPETDITPYNTPFGTPLKKDTVSPSGTSPNVATAADAAAAALGVLQQRLGDGGGREGGGGSKQFLRF